MARGRCTFKQRDVTAAIRAVTKAGIEVSRIEIDPAGKIVVLTGKGEAADDLDRELEDFEKRHAR